MGVMIHHCLIVSHWDKAKLALAREVAVDIFRMVCSEQLVGPLIEGVSNDQCSFAIMPDGSKEGWDISNSCEDARRAFVSWLRAYKGCTFEWVEVAFSGDCCSDRVTQSNKIEQGRNDG